MLLKKVLLFHKRSTYQLQAVEFRDQRFIQLLAQENEAVKRVEKAHFEHQNTLENLVKELEKRNIQVEIKARSALDHKIDDIDLLISVGGDGTFLDASHYLEDAPILGVNSATSSSFGHLCLANDNNISSILDQIKIDVLKPIELLRLEVILNGAPLPQYALNDILVTHQNPAGTSRYLISINGHIEEQLSSGVWIGGPAGSTGALRAAGGSILPVDARKFQYNVRELYLRPGQQKHLLKDVLDEKTEIKMVSQMRTGAIYIDGQHIEYPFKLGDELIIKVAKANLHAFVDRKINERFLTETAHQLIK